jgi:hypothetical protein
VLSSLNEAARRKLEEMMSSGYQYQSEFALKYVAKGREEGQREGKLEGQREGKLEGQREASGATMAASRTSTPYPTRTSISWRRRWPVT